MYGYSLYISYIFPSYVKSVFPCVFLTLWNQEEVRTWLKSEFWSNLARFGSKNKFLTKWHNDSASFLLEKLKNQVILIKNLNIWPKIKKYPNISQNICNTIFLFILFLFFFFKKYVKNTGPQGSLGIPRKPYFYLCLRFSDFVWSKIKVFN